MPSTRKEAAAAASSSSKTSPIAHKRKRKPGEARFYAVRSGRIPGVYTTWDECQQMINGYAGAQYKSFPTVEEAMLFAAGKNPNPGSKPNRYYAVAVGNKPGIYTEWPAAQAAYTGVKAPKYKKFDTKQEAEEWLRTFEGQSSFALDDEGEDDNEDEDEEDEVDDEVPSEPLAKRHQTEAQFTLATDLDDFGPPVQQIWTDGSSLSNGKKGAVAGVGVFFGDGDPRNISERLAGEVQTNQRAELTAILRALQIVPPTQSVLIWSDSQYAIKCVQEWYIKWEANGWRTHKGPVQNRDLVEAVLVEKRKRDAMGAQTQLQWVKGHATDQGNIGADELAVRGAHSSRAAGVGLGNPPELVKWMKTRLPETRVYLDNIDG